MKQKRPPIIAVLGHIDHGKSTLLDYIRKTNVTETEAGGITQRLSAYEVVHQTKDGLNERITFLDTPGHAAFSRMRLRGVDVADIAILVVSAEEGVKPQTLEALSCIKEGGVPYVVAINKIDKPEANIERTKQNLAEHEVYLEGYGGTVPFVPVSAKRGDGIADLLDVVLLLAEFEELTGDPDHPGGGSIIEASVDTRRGIAATLLITDGTLRIGEYVVSGRSVAPVRLMEDFAGHPIKEATFSSPVRVIGFSSLPVVGTPFTTVSTKKQAEAESLVAAVASSAPTVTPTEEEERPTLPIVIKADVIGVVEAIEGEVKKLPQERLLIKIVGTGTGTITENDVKLASGSAQSLIAGLGVKIDARAKELAERLGITIKVFDVIYELVEWLTGAVATRTPKVAVEEITGSAKILKVFSEAKGKMIVGGRVEKGALQHGSELRVTRRGEMLGTAKITSLRRQKVEVKQVEAGDEFGAEVKTAVAVAPGDMLESVVITMQ